MSTKNVAVYGTLREGFGNHRILAGYEPVVAGRFKLPYRMVSLGGFPGLVADSKDNEVYLEVYEVEDGSETMERLDNLEGYRGPNQRNFYDKVPITVGDREALVYVLDESYADNEAVDCGDWAVFCEGRYRRA